jgi:hypothetical protein
VASTAQAAFIGSTFSLVVGGSASPGDRPSPLCAYPVMIGIMHLSWAGRARKNRESGLLLAADAKLPAAPTSVHEGHNRLLSDDVSERIAHRSTVCPCCQKALTRDLPAKEARVWEAH